MTIYKGNGEEVSMIDCIYIMTQGELDDLRSRLEWYKTSLDFRDAIKEAVDALSAAFAQVAASVEEILKSFSDWYLETIGADPEIYKPRPKPKRPQRKILLRYEPLLDARIQIHKYKRRWTK